MMKSLRQLYAEHHGKVSDKWTLYLDEYDRLFAPYRERPLRLLEIGIQNGGSLEIWSKFFPQAQRLVGCDINPDCARLTYDDARIQVIVGDANAPQIAAQVMSCSPAFDVIIDDGSHKSSDIIKSFLLYFPQIENGGIFVAEDLHCSYWDAFEGGLYDPYSSIAFFKRLADVINHEHWGVARQPSIVIDGILRHFECAPDRAVLAELLASVHSIEFINSICVVRKASASNNVLGTRFIAGQDELVVSDHHRLHGRTMTPSDERFNRWALFDVAPDEAHDFEMAERDALLAERDAMINQQGEVLRRKDEEIAAALHHREMEMSRLLHKAQEHQEQIGAYHHAVMERDAIVSAMQRSRSWRLTAPLRAVSALVPRMRYRLVGVHGLIKRDGLTALIGKTWGMYRRYGVAGLRERVAMSLRGYHAAVAAQNQTVTLRPMADYLPVSSTTLESVPQVGVDVIIPVYRGLQETRNCIESVLRATCTIRARVVIIDDCSPEPEVSAYLCSLPQSADFVVLRNDENLGFVRTVNRGMRLEPSSDVVLLNSDTEVSDGWLDRLVRHGYRSDRVASVTPFSNNATICSYPCLEGTRRLPSGESLASLNKAFWVANAGRSAVLPTAIGFCMFIRRACLDEIGLFDEEAFGKGYGEENDFCLRAIAKGWHHLLAADTFVFHAGEVSFQDSSSPGKARAMEILRMRYPEYERSVADHVQLGEAEPFRIAATAARFRLSGLPVFLMIGHHLGGGTEKHMFELVERLGGRAHCLILSPKKNGNGLVSLVSGDPADGLSLDLMLPTHAHFLVEILKSFGLSRIHVHHVLGMPHVLQEIVTRLGTPFDFTVHDYFAVCPQINLAIDGVYCGEPDAGGCNRCIADRPVHGAKDIVWWRQQHAWLLDDADRVICPSHDVANRVLRYRPAASIVVASHEVIASSTMAVPALRQGEPLRVVLLGWLAKHKGAPLVAECVKLAQQRGNNAVHFYLIGRSIDEIEQSQVYRESGEYDDSQLSQLIDEANPHVVWLASTWPETYSYTLSAVLSAGRAVVVPDIGAFPERVSGRPWSWVAPWNQGAGAFLDMFTSMRANFEDNIPPALPSRGEPPAEGFYDDGYFIPSAAATASSAIDLRRPGLTTVLAVVEFLTVLPSPCAYIRVLLPLTAANKNINVRIVNAVDVTHYIADVVYTHRIAMHGSEIQAAVEHCRRHGMQLIYDLDDDLLAIAESEHPEREYYAAYAPSIRLLTQEADEVRVSTNALKERLSALNGNVRLVQNALDAETWMLNKPEQPRIQDAKISILYMGTLTHGADFDLVKEALKAIKAKFGERVSVNIVGVTADRDELAWCDFVDVPPQAGGSYPAFAKWIATECAFDVGIAPLVDSSFNRGKSGIKFYDYAALGLACVCSDVEAYRSVVRHGENGLLVANRTQAWIDALERLVTDHTYREALAACARQDLLSAHTLQSESGGAPFRVQPLALGEAA
nr:glycosyltransferase [uncultured Cupriavidus sp.]